MLNIRTDFDIRSKSSYTKPVYCYFQLLLDAAENILAPFGFERRLLGAGKARITDWKKELSMEREEAVKTDIKLEPRELVLIVGPPWIL